MSRKNLKGLNTMDKKIAEALLNFDLRARFMLEDIDGACRIARFGLPSSMSVLDEKSYRVLAKKARRLAYEFVETFKDSPNYHNSAYFLAQDLRIPLERRTDLAAETSRFVDKSPGIPFRESSDCSPDYNLNLFEGRWRFPLSGADNFQNFCDDVMRAYEGASSGGST